MNRNNFVALIGASVGLLTQPRSASLGDSSEARSVLQGGE